MIARRSEVKPLTDLFSPEEFTFTHHTKPATLFSYLSPDIIQALLAVVPNYCLISAACEGMPCYCAYLRFWSNRLWQKNFCYTTCVAHWGGDPAIMSKKVTNCIAHPDNFRIGPHWHSIVICIHTMEVNYLLEQFNFKMKNLSPFIHSAVIFFLLQDRKENY